MLSDADSASITLRPAVSADLARILEIRSSVKENPEDPMRPMPAEWRLAAIERGACWVCCSGDVIAGFVQTGSTPALIGGLFVHPNHAGHGIGRKLLRHAVEHLHAGGATEIWLSTLPGTRAAKLYEADGWTISGGAPPEVTYVLSLVSKPYR